MNPRQVLLNAHRGMIHDHQFPMGQPLTTEGGKEIARLRQDGVGAIHPQQRAIVKKHTQTP